MHVSQCILLSTAAIFPLVLGSPVVLITCDGNGVPGRVWKTKKQFKVKESAGSKPKGATWGKDKVGRMLLFSFHSEMVTQGQIVNALLYCSFLRHQRETFVFFSRMKLMLKGGHIAMLVEIKHTADARTINQNRTGEGAQASIFVEDKSGTSTGLINITSTMLDRWCGVLRITSCFSRLIILLQLHVGFICTKTFLD